MRMLESFWGYALIGPVADTEASFEMNLPVKYTCDIYIAWNDHGMLCKCEIYD